MVLPALLEDSSFGDGEAVDQKSECASQCSFTSYQSSMSHNSLYSASGGKCGRDVDSDGNVESDEDLPCDYCEQYREDGFCSKCGRTISDSDHSSQSSSTQATYL